MGSLAARHGPGPSRRHRVIDPNDGEGDTLNEIQRPALVVLALVSLRPLRRRVLGF